MDTSFLESLIAVVETGSIASAGRRQNLTATAVSQRIRALERDFGCELLTRGAHSATPTEACLALLPRAESVLREVRLMQADAERDALAGEIRVGAISTLLTSLVPPLLEEMATKAPALKLTLVPGSSAQLFNQLSSGTIDAAILVKPPFKLAKGLACSRLRLEPLVLISRHLSIERPPEEVISSEPFIRYDPESWGGQRVDAYLRDRKLEPEVRFDLDALETISLLVTKGLGNSVVPLWSGLENTDVRLRNLPDAEAYAREIVLLHPSLPSRPKATALLRDIATAIASRI